MVLLMCGIVVLLVRLGLTPLARAMGWQPSAEQLPAGPERVRLARHQRINHWFGLGIGLCLVGQGLGDLLGNSTLELSGAILAVIVVLGSLLAHARVPVLPV